MHLRMQIFKPNTNNSSAVDYDENSRKYTRVKGAIVKLI